jgi:sugar lactone lactonase YvrE
VRLDDPEAVYLTPENFDVRGDGVADDSDALQSAIDAVAAKGHPGVLFVPDGHYRLGKTVYVWPGVRLIGYGAMRPVFVLGASTPGFQDGEGKYMLYFSGGRGREAGDPPRDGSPGTFYSAMSNIDIEIGPGNPAAVAIRFHVAQHCYLSHMTLRLGSAKAGLEDIGNEVEDLHFIGGSHGIITARSAPGWPILVIDCTFEDQRKSAITCNEAGLAIIRPTIRRTPVAIAMDEGRPDELWVSDAQLEDISDAAVIISREHNARTQVNLENLVCRNVPTLARFRESDTSVEATSAVYRVNYFSHGLHIGGMGAERVIETRSDIEPLDNLPTPVATDIADLPPADTWVNVKTLGAKGDGETDDTDALRQAIANHRVIYLPIGVYRVTDTLRLRPDTVLIGLQPGSTVLYVANESEAFMDADAPRPVIETPPGGTNILSGIGVYTGAVNPGAVGIKWMAGANSLVNDVRLHGGHGTRLPGDIGDSRGRDHRDHWDTQPPSLWVTDGGGGVFKDIWTPSPYAKAGMMVSDTSTRGRLYAMSAEHHVSHEVILRKVTGWRFYGLQFEAEREESPKALPLLIEDSHDVLFANTFFYRVVSSFEPYAAATVVRDSTDIRFRNVHIYSNSKVSYDSAVRDAESGAEVRDPEFAVLDVSRELAPHPSDVGNGIVAPGSSVEKLADGFSNISGAAVNDRGEVYFADPRSLQIHRWDAEQRRVVPVRKIPERPEQLAFDQSGHLLVVAYEGDGAVLAFDPTDPDSEVITIEPQPAVSRPDRIAVLPVNRWMGGENFMEDSAERKPFHYVSPDGSTFIPAGEGFTTGATSWGTKLADLLRAFSLAPVKPGERFYVSNELELRTWSFEVDEDGTLSDPKLFVEEGGEGVAVDADGNVYIAAGQVRVFDPAGKPLGTIDVPRRPTSLAFGGPDGKTLFITARSALYAVRVR